MVMDKVNEDTILHFYRILENSLLESDISKINEDIDAWSQSFKKVVRESREKSGIFLELLDIKLHQLPEGLPNRCRQPFFLPQIITVQFLIACL
jgi:hypothetical protein